MVHIIYRLGTGGLENGLVNLINRTPPGRYRHAIVCLKDATDFSLRLRQQDVPIHCLYRKDGQDFGMFWKLFKLLREIKPDIVHTRNLAAVECLLPAYLAGVARRVHGEHGWDVFDPDGSNRKYQWLRRGFRPLVHRYIPLSRHLEAYLRDKIGVPPGRIRRICNGVDTEVFTPPSQGKARIEGCPFSRNEDLLLIGTVGRMHGVKDQMNLVRAFLHLLQIRPQARSKVRLLLVGDGPLRQEAISALREGGVEDLAWLPGERDDIADILRGLDIFVLPSRAEGISNVILEAMATGLPVLATAVGGNPDLVADGENGRLVEAANPQAMAQILAEYLDDPDILRSQGLEGLRRTREEFSLESMVGRYLAVYDELLKTK
ncbi:MAG: TIGR03088 family PEP-CTERM/XrtA system glycosyltransferase [Methylococcaceae bacterium]|nr:TIGR03088 family PEP-CTERM/XrtA system glycosyltransferase [Methylococcaceae bacterium]